MRHCRSIFASLLFVSLGLAACDSGTASEEDTTSETTASELQTHSCLSPPKNGGILCIDYVGSFWTQTFIESTVCSDDGQVYSPQLCDNAEAVFRCDTATGTENEQITWYIPAPDQAEASARAHCEGALMGTFTVL